MEKTLLGACGGVVEEEGLMRYCQMCDEYMKPNECKECGMPTEKVPQEEPQTYGDLKRLLATSPEGDWPSRVNKGMTHSEALRILRNGLATYPDDQRLDTSRSSLYTRNVMRECRSRR